MRVTIRLEEEHKSTRIQVYDEIRELFRGEKLIPPRIIRNDSTDTVLPLRTLGEYDVNFMLRFTQRLERISHWKYVNKISIS